jgi:phosphoribosylformylglycinamidine synthase subunit PurS
LTTQASHTRWLAAVTVLPKTGVNDPEGEAILGGLHQLGHDSVNRVRAGRLFHVWIDASDANDALIQATRMAEQLLANPVIEQFSVAIVDEQAG